MFKKKPLCELCKKNEATHFSFIMENNAYGNWMFICEEAHENEGLSIREIYSISIIRFFSTPPATVDWIAHLNEKTWMKWKSFADMMDRFRSATDSYGVNT